MGNAAHATQIIATPNIDLIRILASFTVYLDSRLRPVHQSDPDLALDLLD
jgi:hypothetical protein